MTGEPGLESDPAMGGFMLSDLGVVHITTGSRMFIFLETCLSDLIARDDSVSRFYAPQKPHIRDYLYLDMGGSLLEFKLPDYLFVRLGDVGTDKKSTAQTLYVSLPSVMNFRIVLLPCIHSVPQGRLLIFRFSLRSDATSIRSE